MEALYFVALLTNAHAFQGMEPGLSDLLRHPYNLQGHSLLVVVEESFVFPGQMRQIQKGS